MKIIEEIKKLGQVYENETSISPEQIVEKFPFLKNLNDYVKTLSNYSFIGYGLEDEPDDSNDYYTFSLYPMEEIVQTKEELVEEKLFNFAYSEEFTKNTEDHKFSSFYIDTYEGKVFLETDQGFKYHTDNFLEFLEKQKEKMEII